ncbi:MAG: peroxiredoxin [Actinomycetota bacterium]|nr:peroxiredoxin [Actinomycetota bacterium]
MTSKQTAEPTRLRPGDPAPELSLTNADGTQVRLADLRGRPAIVYFFPKAFTPGCTTEVCDFRDNKTALARAGYVLLGVSADPPERLAEFRDANQVNHDLLSDPDHEAARRWAAFGPKVVGGEPMTGPLRSTFVVDADGVIRSAEYELDPNDHVHALLAQVGA